jgi:hypothetical protein
MGLALSGCAVTSLFKSHKGEPGAEEPYPTLGSVPEQPKETESALERRKLAEGLIADRARVQYTDEALRGGTEASAPPPPPPIAARPDGTEMRAVAARGADGDEPEEDRPGLFGRLFGGKEAREKETRDVVAAPEADETSASDAASKELDAPSKASAESATGALPGVDEESTGATEIGMKDAESEKRGLFRRLFKAKTGKGSQAPAAEAPPMKGAPGAGEEESTGATATREGTGDRSGPGLFRRLFGGKKSTESESDGAPSALPEAGTSPAPTPMDAQ